jgi:transposase
LQIVIGLLADEAGEPLAVRVFQGNTADPTTVVEQIKMLQEQFAVPELVFVGDRGMVKSQGKQALSAAGLRYITALTDPQIRRLLGQGTLQLSLFSETVTEVEGEGVRYILRKNPQEAEREHHRLQDKLAKLEAQVEARNQQVREHPRGEPEAGQRRMQAWVERHKLTGAVEILLVGKQLQVVRHEEAITRALELAGCYVVTTDVAPADLSAQQVHDSYVALTRVERDFRTLKTGLLEVRPVWVRKARRTRGHVFCCLLALKVSREMERRLQATFGTTDRRAEALTLPDALRALARLCLLHYRVDEKTTVTQLPQPDARQQAILKALGVTLPAM